MNIILASSSPYRQAILARSGLTFRMQSPQVDESPKPNESAARLVVRLATAKAQAVARSSADALVIGADQVASVAGCILGKPHTHANAVAQLQQSSNATVTLYSGVALLNTASGRLQTRCDRYTVRFRPLTPARIEHYLQQAQPYDCCGSLKAEGVGIALLRTLRGNDPNTLFGLPMIALVEMLENEGVDLITIGGEPCPTN